MLKSFSRFLAILLLVLTAPKAQSGDLTQESSFILRFTGIEAQNLTDFMRERFRRETDDSQAFYYGDRMSLACREGRDCYLWLVRNEWLAEASGFTFTLPLKQNTFSGRITFGPNHSVQIELRDLLFPGSFSFARPLVCPENKAVLHPNGDCRIELATAPKKSPVPTPSFQSIQNVRSIIMSFKGPWAQRLFKASPHQGPDPYHSQRLRATLGSEAYCWNLDPLGEDRFLNDAYVCQVKLSVESGLGVTQNLTEGRIHLIPTFRHQILQDFEAVLHHEGVIKTITHCPNASKTSGFGQCWLFYDRDTDPGFYPLGDSVQGVAVGWGVIKETMDKN